MMEHDEDEDEDIEKKWWKPIGSWLPFSFFAIFSDPRLVSIFESMLSGVTRLIDSWKLLSYIFLEFWFLNFIKHNCAHKHRVSKGLFIPQICNDVVWLWDFSNNSGTRIFGPFSPLAYSQHIFLQNDHVSLCPNGIFFSKIFMYPSFPNGISPPIWKKWRERFAL